MYDPASGKFTLINTCFSTHHLNLRMTPQHAVAVGRHRWAGRHRVVNRKMYEETGDEVKSQGWTAFIVDTNANGKRDAYVEPNQPTDPTKDKRVLVTTYAVAVSPSDGAVWARKWPIPAASSGSHQVLIRPTPRLPKSIRCRCPASARAAAMSTATACTGRRWQAGISAASTAANARS